MNTRTVSTSAVCKHCGSIVMIEKQGIWEGQHLSGGITSKACRNCHKTSNYVFEIKDFQFISIY